jgi:hypothetical protein
MSVTPSFASETLGLQRASGAQTRNVVLTWDNQPAPRACLASSHVTWLRAVATLARRNMPVQAKPHE